MLDVLLSGLVTGLAIAVPVGAVAALIITLSARTSWTVGAAAGLGVATVDGVYATIAVVAGKAVAELLEPVEGTLQIVSAVALLMIAALTLAHSLRPERAPDGRDGPSWTPLRAWLTFVGITAVNPATVVYFAAIVLGGTVDIDGMARASSSSPPPSWPARPGRSSSPRSAPASAAGSAARAVVVRPGW